MYQQLIVVAAAVVVVLVGERRHQTRLETLLSRSKRKKSTRPPTAADLPSGRRRKQAPSLEGKRERRERIKQQAVDSDYSKCFFMIVIS